MDKAHPELQSKHKSMKEDNPTNRFQEIMDEIIQLATEAFELLPRDTGLKSRAEAYWYPTIIGCVDGRATMYTMDNTLDELKKFTSEITRCVECGKSVEILQEALNNIGQCSECSLVCEICGVSCHSEAIINGLCPTHSQDKE